MKREDRIQIAYFVIVMSAIVHVVMTAIGV